MLIAVEAALAQVPGRRMGGLHLGPVIREEGEETAALSPLVDDVQHPLVDLRVVRVGGEVRQLYDAVLLRLVLGEDCLQHLADGETVRMRPGSSTRNASSRSSSASDIRASSVAPAASSSTEPR